MGPILAVYAFNILIGWAIGASKGKSVEGTFLAALLGPIGWILAAVMSPTTAIQAKRDVDLEAERERLREEGRAQARAEQQQPYRTEIGRPPGG